MLGKYAVFPLILAACFAGPTSPYFVRCLHHVAYSSHACAVRNNYLSRAVEAALQAAGVPHRVLSGHKFFERMEVKDLLAYLQLVDNPHFAPAFTRAVNTPPRGLGEKSVTELLGAALRKGCTPLAIAEGIVEGRFPDIKPPARKKLTSFVAACQKLRECAEGGATPVLLLRALVDLIGYSDYLRRSQDDWEARLQNVEELVNFAAQAQQTASDTER